MTPMELLAWHRTFGQVVEKLDDAAFWLSIVRLLRAQLDFQTWMVVIYSETQHPSLLAGSGENQGSDEQLLRDYREGLYLLDPFYIANGKNRRHGLYRLDDVVPDCFDQTEYYRRYFQRNVVVDEVQYSVALDTERTLCLSLGSRHRYDDHTMGLLTMVKPWLLPLIRQRMHFEENPSTSKVARPLPLSDNMLTEREREVNQLMLSGCSTKAIAQRLDISIETVRTHKKHLYHKLGVNTQSELFALFWAQYSPS